MIKVEFYTLDAGWISGQIINDEIKYYFHYSWISNFLSDFLKGLLYINGCLEDDLYLENFTAYVEPAVDDWKLVKTDNILTINIDSFEDDSREIIIESIKIQCDYYEFVKALIEGLTLLIQKIGLYGYFIEWDEEFPLSLFLKLYDICQVSPILSLKELTLEETCGRGGNASEVNKELDLLQDIFK